MPFTPEQRAAWRITYRDKQRELSRQNRRRKAEERAQAILALPDREAASHYLMQMGFHGKAQSIVAAWGRKHPAIIEREAEDRRSHDKRYRRRIRAAAIEALGGRCECCGLDVTEVLEFDHRTPVLRRTNGVRNRDAADQARRILNGEAHLFQLLCANCHTLKTRMNGEHSGGNGDVWGEVLEDVWDGY